MKIEGFNCDLRSKAKTQTQPVLLQSDADTVCVSLCHVNVKGLTLATSSGATDPQKGDQAQFKEELKFLEILARLFLMVKVSLLLVGEVGCFCGTFFTQTSGRGVW